MYDDILLFTDAWRLRQGSCATDVNKAPITVR